MVHEAALALTVISALAMGVRLVPPPVSTVTAWIPLESATGIVHDQRPLVTGTVADIGLPPCMTWRVTLETFAAVPVSTHVPEVLVSELWSMVAVGAGIQGEVHAGLALLRPLGRGLPL